MKFQILLLVFCLIVSPSIAFFSWLQNFIPTTISFFQTGIKEITTPDLRCYQCTNQDETGICAQGQTTLKKCEMRNLLSRFGGFLKTKILGKPTVKPVCLRAEIQVGENLTTRHSCAMVIPEKDALDEATCTSLLYMVGGITGDVEKCELCATRGCNTHKPPTPRAQPVTWNPYVQPSALMRNMELGHVQVDVQSMRHKSNASPLVASLALLISTVLLVCIN